jgi:acetyl esterase/lipase
MKTEADSHCCAVNGGASASGRRLFQVLRACAAMLMGLASWQPAQAQPAVNVSANQTFGGNGQKLDLYTPSRNLRRTAVLFIHGGGFTSGSKADMAGHAGLYAKGGFVTASLDYRLAPRFPAPAAVIDVNDAVDWLKGHASVSRVVVVGYSAGGLWR